MPSVRFCVVLGIFCTLLLSACGGGGGGQYFVAKEEPWRATEERACLASGTVQESPFIKTKLSLGGPSVCGAERPFELAAGHFCVLFPEDGHQPGCNAEGMTVEGKRAEPGPQPVHKVIVKVRV